MRTILSLVAMLVAAASAPAADPPNIKGAFPCVVLAQAASKDGKAMLSVKQPVTVYKDVAETIQFELVEKVDGKEVKRLATKTVTKKISNTEWHVTEVRLGDQGVSVTDATGKAVSPTDVLKRLEKETAILRAVGGPADPFYLQTTKTDTLVLVTPLPPPPPATPVMPILVAISLP